MTDVSGSEPGRFGHAGWEQTFRCSPLGMALVVDETIVQANDALAALLGLRCDQIDGRPVFDLVDGHLLADGVDAAYAAYERGDRRFHLEGPMRRGDGQPLWVAIDGVIIDDRPPAASLATVIDLTDLHGARLDLAASERRFRSLLTNLSDTVSLATSDAEVIYSTHGDGVLGYPMSFWAGRSALDTVHPDDLPGALDAWASMLEKPGEQSTRELRMQRADGEWEDVSVTAANRLDDPDVAGIVLTTRAITAQRQAERIAAGQAEVLERIARGESLDAVTAACVAFVEANGLDGQTAIYLLEGARLELRAGRAPESLSLWLREPTRSIDRSLCDTAMTSGAPAIMTTFEGSDLAAGLRVILEEAGIEAAWSQPIQSISTGEAIGSLCTVFPRPHTPTEHELQVADVACSLIAVAIERHQNEVRLAHQARHDALTGLPNRAYLLERLDHVLDRAHFTGPAMALLFCDIDRLKVVNDSLGHGVGDHLLVAFAERLRASVGPGDTVARFGGDEFVVLLEDVDGPGAPGIVADRLAAELERPFLLGDGQEVFLTVSVGLAHDAGHTTGDAWLRDADAAMYRAKDRGGNQLVPFDAAMRHAALERMQVENDLRRAIDRNELVVHHQPVVDLRTGRIVGAEALVRWNHPEQGLLPPDAFIPVAEDTGMIHALGNHVLDLAISDAAWLQRELADRNEQLPDRFRLGVNVSARQLATPGLDAAVAAACERQGWPLERLLLEITESALLHRLDGPVDVLTRIHDMGVDLAIDDFGTGYSSLTRLGHMPASFVKIDRTFVAAIDQPDSPLVQVVDAVVALAGALDLKVTAEGVETQQQLDYLRLLSCDHAQGFLFSPALPIEEFVTLLHTDLRW